MSLDEVVKTADMSGKFFSDFKGIFGTGTTITNNEIKDIIKIIKSLENRGISLKGTTRNITSQEGVFLNFLKLLTTAGFLLTKIVLATLAKIFLIPLGLTASGSAADAAIQKKTYGWGTTTALIILNEEVKDIIKKLNHSKNQDY